MKSSLACRGRYLAACLCALLVLPSSLALAAESDTVEAYLAGDYARVRQEWSAMAQRGDPVATFNLAMLYVQGLGVPREPRRAMDYLERAAAAGYAPAQYQLALSNAPGGAFDDPGAAIFWMTRAARQGHAMAAWRLGGLLAEQPDAARSGEALDWLRRAEEAGITEATASIRSLESTLPGGELEGDDVTAQLSGGRGTMAQRRQFYEGQKAFVRQNYAGAVEAWAPLAEAGVARAQYGIAFMLESGWGVVQDYAEAAYWYKLAAQKGHPKAQFNLGRMYLDGRGVRRDRGSGLYWIQSAADAGEPRAQELMSTIR